MNVRKLAVVVAFTAFGVPFAANADAPSGDFEELFPQSMNADQPQFPRSEYEAYVEHWLDEALAANEKFPKTREQVLQELAASPLEVVGA